MKRPQSLKLLLGVVAATLAFAAPSSAQQAAPGWQPSSVSQIESAPWQFQAALYGWMPKAPATIESGGNKVKIPEDFSTILDSLEFAFMGHGVARKGPLSVFVSPIFYKGEYDDRIKVSGAGSAKGTVEESVWLVNYGLSYEIGKYHFGDASSPKSVAIEPFVGGSYLHDPIEVKIDPARLPGGLEIDETVEYNTPIIGLRTHWDLSNGWQFHVGGFYGGFNVDDVDKTYEISAVASYDFKSRKVPARWFFGWRHTKIDYDDGDLAFDVKITGPLIGIGFDF